MDGGGKPVFAFSSLSSHTPDIKADPRCSLTVTALGFQVSHPCLHLLHVRTCDMFIVEPGQGYLSPLPGQSQHRVISQFLAQGMASGRVTVSGKVAILEGDDAAAAKKAFLAKNPQSFWVEFGDFSWFRMDTVVTARLVGGFGRIKQVPSQPHLPSIPVLSCVRGLQHQVSLLPARHAKLCCPPKLECLLYLAGISRGVCCSPV